MNAAKLLAWVLLPVVGLVVVWMLAIWVLHALLGLLTYIIVGALVVGGVAYLYRRTKRAVGPGTRTRRRIEAAAATYRMRNR